LYLFTFPSISLPSLNKCVCLLFPCGCMTYLYVSLNYTHIRTHVQSRRSNHVFTLPVCVVAYGIRH
jgi:hypothetical protein